MRHLCRAAKMAQRNRNDHRVRRKQRKRKRRDGTYKSGGDGVFSLPFFLLYSLLTQTTVYIQLNVNIVSNYTGCLPEKSNDWNAGREILVVKITQESTSIYQ